MSELNQPLYQMIYNYLIENIKSGKYTDGDRVPSEKELAEEFGVSRITSKKALEMLAENGYIKRMPGKGSFVVGNVEREAGTGINSSSTRIRPLLIGVVISDFDVSYGAGLLSGIEKEATENGCFIIPRRSCGRQDCEEQAIEDLLDMGVDGILVMPVHGENYNHKILKMVLDKFPFVLIDRYLKGIGVSFVGSDNVAASKKACDYLLDIGHKNISFLSPPYVDTSTIEDRIEGFIKSHSEHGMIIDESIWLTDLTCTMPGKNSQENILSDIEKIKLLLENNKQITCLFAAEYNIALLAMEAIKSLGLKVPHDVSVLCFDGPKNYIGEYFFTHIRQREEEMGATAVKLLLKQMLEKEEPGIKKFLDTDLVIGASTKENK